MSGPADEKSEMSQEGDHHMSTYSNGFGASSVGEDQAVVGLELGVRVY